MKKPVRFLLSLTFFAVLLLYNGSAFYYWVFPSGSFAGWYVKNREPGVFLVREVDQNGPATALRVEDFIVAINGKLVNDHADVINEERRLPPGSPYSMTVRRDDQDMTFQWNTVARLPLPFPWPRLIWLFFLLSGLTVLLLRPDDQAAWLLALMLGCFSGLLGGGFEEEIVSKWLQYLASFARIGGLFAAPLIFHLFLYFPSPSPWLRRWPSLPTWLYLPFILFSLPLFGVSRLPLEWSTKIFTWPPMVWLLGHGLYWVAFVPLEIYVIAALVCLVISYWTADAAARRRLRVVTLGSLIGFGNLFLILVMEATGMKESFKTLWDWLTMLNLFTLPLVPLSFGYAIIRHRVIPISLIIRSGVRYLLVSRGSIVLMLLFTGTIVALLLAFLFHYLQPSGLTIGLISAAEAIAAWQVARVVHRRYLAPVIDRKFFRQAYDAQQIVTELSESVRMTTDVPSLLEIVAKKLQTALQTENVAILLRDNATGDYQTAYACEYSKTEGEPVSTSSSSVLNRDLSTVAQIRKTGEPLELDDSNPMNAALLLPLKTKDAMIGIIALGPRLGDLPFSGEDKRLLKSVGNSASLALENAQLVEKMIAEATRRKEVEAENEQRARELEEARQLQLSMLPRLIPQVPHFEIAAYMKPAAEVGGDYYDFYLSPDGQLTIAIGDATGHGLKAGTVVTATKGLFNHLAGEPDLVATLEQTSRALKQMNLRSLFMALTLVKLTGNQLQCSVAGMPPILIYRASTKSIEEVPLHGVPLGGLTNYEYRQAEVTLSANDVVLLLSDGLPERFNPNGEMFGYERTREFLRVNATASPKEMLERLLQESDKWAESRPADDDMTFVAVRRKATNGLDTLPPESFPQSI